MSRFRYLKTGFILFCFFCISISQAEDFPHLKTWNITEFGARADGKTLNTLAIQSAIDACTKAGGGIVEIPSGIFLTGTLFLKSNVQLRLDADAVLKADEKRENYQVIATKNPGGEHMFGESGSFLIYAENATNISMEGSGKIDGSGRIFWLNEMINEFVKKPKEWRPWALVCLVNCKNIDIQNVTFINSPCYTVWNIGCKNLNIDGIKIRNPIDGPNTDGLDIDCCQNVTIKNCDIEGGDDAIAIKSDGGRLGKNRPCKNIAVAHCILSSPPACAVRVGYEGDAPIKNCNFQQLTIKNCNHGIDIVSIVANRQLFPMENGTRIKEIHFRDITMDRVTQPVYLWMGNERNEIKPLSYIKNICIENLSAINSGHSFIGSTLSRSIENVKMKNISVKAENAFDENTKFTRNVWGSKNPFVFYFYNTKNLKINNLQVEINQKGFWEHVIYFENSGNVFLENLRIAGQENIKKNLPVETKNTTIKIGFHSKKP